MQIAQTSAILLQDLSGLCVHTKSKPFHSRPCPSCMLCCSQRLRRLRPLAMASFGLCTDTQHTCVGIDGKLGGSLQQQLIAWLHFPLRLAVLGEWFRPWEGTGGRKNPWAGGNAPTSKCVNSKPPKKRKNQTEKNGKKHRKLEKGPKPPKACFPVFESWKGIPTGLCADEKMNPVETMRKQCRGAALERGSLPTSRRSAHGKLASRLFHLQTRLSAQRHGLPRSFFAIVLDCFAA